MMKKDEIIEQINSCIECEACLEMCDTFTVTQNLLQSPNGRLKIAKKIFIDENISEDELKGIYTCTLCGMCDQFCQKEISISEIILESKMELVEKNIGPLDIHKKITSGIIEKENSVNGNPEERLNWLPEEYLNSELFEDQQSNTLLFLGCMSSFRVKESASASYQLLREGGYNFKIFKKEPCCGEYVYSSGNLQLAKKMFQENFDTFKKAGIKTIVATCGGCLYAFNNVYPKYVDDWDIEVKHVMQVIHELFQQKKLKFKKSDIEITYHDPCRTGRKLKNMDIFDEPRELLDNSSKVLHELSKNKEFTPCCGAGSGIRGVDSSISIKIAKNLFDDLKTEIIVSSCPLCIFNFNYVNYKTQAGIKPIYITEYLLENLEKLLLE
ncbi:MAG: (Fe-S)-binding protein [Candidatus Lokiarchaeota archaeon]|nr:(Fe-S)-binding protein [Candidatus Lokiarchaeota archaeon]